MNILQNWLSSRSFKKNWWLIVLLLVSLLARWPLLTGSFWLDEAAQALEVARPWSRQLQIEQDFQPPLFHLLLHVWQYFSHAEWWLRLVSLIFGVASIGLVFHILSKRLKPPTAFFVSLWLATNSLHVFYSQELRPYMLATFFASLALWAYLNLSTSLKWFVFGLAMLGGALSSYVFVFFWPAFWIASWLIEKRPRSQVWSLSQVLLVCGVVWMSWLPGLWQQLQVSHALRVAIPNWEKVVSLSLVKAIPLSLAKFIVGVIEIDLNVGWFVFFCVLGLIAIYSSVIFWQKSTSKDKRYFLFLTVLIGSTLLLSWIFSIFTPVILPKRVLFLLPVLALILGQLTITKIGRWLVFVLILINLWTLGAYWTKPALQRENWRSLVWQLESRYQSDNTVLIFGFAGPFAPWQWYQTENLPVVSTGLTPLTSIEQAQEKLTGFQRYENVILFDYLLDLTDPDRYLQKVIEDAGYYPLDVLDYEGVGFIRLYYRQKLFAKE